MGISIIQSAFVGTGSQSIALSSIIGVTGPDHPHYVVVTAVDREAYTAGASGETGSFVGNGHIDSMSVALASAGLESMGIVFSYNAATGQYTNATYGNLSQLVYRTSSSANDMTQISVFATNNQADTVNAANFVTMETTYGATDYVGTATVCTQPGFTGTIPSNATPGSIEHAALSFVGRTWNKEGCWILANTIAAEAGASLPASTCFSETPIGGGEWFVAFNGATAAAGTNWISQIKAGEVIAIPGHITTCVSGSGYGAMLVDNAQTGHNQANDGSASDIIIQKPFSALSEFFGVAASGVVIYELDCPTVTAVAPSLTVAKTALSALFSATDPHGTAITKYQVYDSLAADHFAVGNRTLSATSAASALTVSSLSAVTFLGTGAADTIQVRAENSLGYWGDWQTVKVTAAATATAAIPTAAPQVQAVAGAKPAGIGTMNIIETATNSSNLPASVSITAAGIDAPFAHHQSDVTFQQTYKATDELAGAPPANLAANISIEVTATHQSGLAPQDMFMIEVMGASRHFL